MTDSLDPSDLGSQLINSVQRLNRLNLYQSAKWCAEALNGLSKQESTAGSRPNQLLEEDYSDYDKVLLAQSYFHCKEFDRAAQVLEGCKSGDAKFLRLYATLISIDKRSTEDSDGVINVGSNDANVLDGSGASLNDYTVNDQTRVEGSLNIANSKYMRILTESEEYLSTKEDPFLYYLNGIIYRKKKKTQTAQKNLYQSLVLFPFNWSCWRELIDSFITYEEAQSFIQKVKKKNESFASTVMFQFFEMVVLQESHQSSSRLFELVNNLSSLFPSFTFIKVQQFLIAYHNLDYYQAESIFDHILIEDPSRLEDLDTYSNMLYVMEKKSKLSYLAQYASQVDRFRPETCCVLANYYSMKSEHEKAIMYYKRALILNKDCLSAWTLMGHEFVELKNSHAAIESYRRAVDTNPKDFRAWYGLGQAYEVLDMHLYALYYYQRATNLQPSDKRMWQAIGNCYEKIDQLEDAIKSFEKALTIGKLSPAGNGEYPHDTTITSADLNVHHIEDSEEFVEPHICYRLAILLEKLDNVEDTFKYMRLCFSQEAEWGVSDETSKARLWLARKALDNGKFSEAYELAKNLNNSNVHDVEEARAIARDARNRMKK
ncbi:Cdc23 protein [Candida orthopsilosis Co 90-125]|uniref:Cdc23 protein n=1 Tax=Candida orthopsilosis (strain 90-125) TaxID=1136231 RepID=H8X5F2_CANO9|nr:Cdc23 protein [Candida orthopsilosis Co 90-125]CCG23408.1 Cdc23 protein [Candida orthopsilosis Co 90-125]